MGLLDDEISQWKRSFALLSTINPANDAVVRGLLGVPSKLDDTLYSKSELYRGAKDAITAPIRAWRGELDPYSPEGVQEALNTAGYAMLGGMPGGARGPGSVGMAGMVKQAGKPVMDVVSRTRKEAESAMQELLRLKATPVTATDGATFKYSPRDHYIADRNYPGRNTHIINGERFSSFGPFDVRGPVAEHLNAVRKQRAVANDLQGQAESLQAYFNAPQSHPEIPDWLQQITNQPAASHAGPEWWKDTLGNKRKSRVAGLLDELGAKDSSFLYGKSQVPTTGDVADIANYYSRFGVKIEPEWIGDTLRLHTGNGGMDIYNMGNPDDDAVIRSIGLGSEGKANGGGKNAYQAALTMLNNNGRIQYPDTAITHINELRKAGNTLSAQMRHEKPIVDANFLGLSGLQDNPTLMMAEAKEARKRVPAIKALEWDGGQFSINGQPATDKTITALIAGVDPIFSQGVGVMTAKRAALEKYASKGGDLTGIAKKLPGPVFAGLLGASVLTPADNIGQGQ